MAIGSRRITPTWPVAAAVVSEPIEAPTRTPWAQSRASNTSGTSDARRPPNTIAENGTPCPAPRSDERHVGKGGVRTGRSRWGPAHSLKQTKKTNKHKKTHKHMKNQ